MKPKAWMWVMLLAPSGLHAQIAPLVEFWTGLDTTVVPGGKMFLYTGSGDFTVGGVPVPIDAISLSYAMGWDPARGRYEYSFNRSDSSPFPGFDFSISNEPMDDTVPSQLTFAVFTMEFFPFLDVRDTTLSPAGMHFPVAMEPFSGADTLPLAGFFDTAYPLMARLDPTHTYGDTLWDTLWLSGTEPFMLILEDTLSLPQLPLACNPTEPLTHHYYLVFEDTVQMWDGSVMFLHLDRHYWMVPGCFIVKDSVYRTLAPLVARGKAAQSQTFSSSAALDNIVSVQENPIPSTGYSVRLHIIPRGIRLEGVSANHRIQVLDLSGRSILSGKGLRELNLPAGRYVLVVEDPVSRARWVLKGISVR